MCNRFFSSTFILILIRHYTTVTYSIKITAFMLTFKSSAIVHKFEFLHVIWSDFTWHKNFFPPFIVIGSDTCQNILPNKKKTLQEFILLFLCLYRLIRRRGIKYKILTSYQNKICAICLAKCSILSYHSRYLMSISLQALNSSSWVVFYSYSCEYMHKLLHTCKCPSGLFTGQGHLQKAFVFMSYKKSL